MEELSTEIAYQRLEAVEEGSLCLPEDCKTGTFTEVDNNIDRLEETLSCIKCFLWQEFVLSFFRFLDFEKLA